jgi:hypothetical protein
MVTIQNKKYQPFSVSLKDGTSLYFAAKGNKDCVKEITLEEFEGSLQLKNMIDAGHLRITKVEGEEK